MNAIPKTNCPLCSAESYPYSGREFCRCRLCKAIFRLPEFRLLPEKEKKRYQEHNNDIHDPKYRNFVSPITNEITNRYGPQRRGLDFGSGTGPVVFWILQEQGYDIRQYDPFFCPDRRVLNFYYEFLVIFA